MVGLKTRLTQSIQFRLSLWLSVAILLVAVAAGGFAYVGAYDEAQEMQDELLGQVASLLTRQRTVLQDAAADDAADPETRLFVQYLSAAGGPAGSSDGAAVDAAPQRQRATGLPLPAQLPNGLQTVALPQASYRVLVATLPAGARIAVAQDTAVRDELASDSAVRTVLPLLVLVPVLLLLVADIVRRLLKPVASLSANLEARGEAELHALPEQGLPTEIRPFVLAINRLLARVSNVLGTQRRFVADAAHELRSPLTALSLQAERLATGALSEEARARLVVLRRGITRGSALLEQLLAYAKVQAADAAGNANPANPTQPASSQARLVLRQVLEDLWPQAEAKHIDIGLVGDGDARVAIGETALGMLLKNLVDNAIRYTPAGGRIDLQVHCGATTAMLVVADTGPGITPEERERVLEPFYRTLGTDQTGSGLGLAIVQAIVDRHGGQLTLGYADTHTNPGAPFGLCATVLLPLAHNAVSTRPERGLNAA